MSADMSGGYPPGPRGRASPTRAAGASGDQRVAGLVDGGRDVGEVDRLLGEDRDPAARQVDVDPMDAAHEADLTAHGALAVAAGHSDDLEGTAADESAGGLLIMGC